VARVALNAVTLPAIPRSDVARLMHTRTVDFTGRRSVTRKEHSMDLPLSRRNSHYGSCCRRWNKVVDYFDNTTTNYYTFRFYEFAKYFTKLDHIFAMATWIVDAKWFARLSKAHQDAIEKSAAEIRPLIPELLAKTDDAALAKAVGQGAKVFVVKDKAPWQKLMAPIWDQYSAKIPDSKASIAAIGAL
jgi:Bacterial extracellular solute-binding protein, family 7